MAKTENKTKVNDASVTKFLKSVGDEQQREDSFQILDMMAKVSKEQPRMWGSSIVGFGTYHYKYATGREGDTMMIGFSPRKQNITFYIMDGFEKYDELLGRLGKHATGKSCLYIKRLSDVDPKVLKEIMSESLKAVRKANPSK